MTTTKPNEIKILIQAQHTAEALVAQSAQENKS
jgi:hypothetical protein